jgi:hypothetical protein
MIPSVGYPALKLELQKKYQWKLYGGPNASEVKAAPFYVQSCLQGQDPIPAHTYLVTPWGYLELPNTTSPPPHLSRLTYSTPAAASAKQPYRLGEVLTPPSYLRFCVNQTILKGKWCGLPRGGGNCHGFVWVVVEWLMSATILQSLPSGVTIFGRMGEVINNAWQPRSSPVLLALQYYMSAGVWVVWNNAMGSAHIPNQVIRATIPPWYKTTTLEGKTDAYQGTSPRNFTLQMMPGPQVQVMILIRPDPKYATWPTWKGFFPYPQSPATPGDFRVW